jgi:hypothetical protein
MCIIGNNDIGIDEDASGNFKAHSTAAVAATVATMAPTATATVTPTATAVHRP